MSTPIDPSELMDRTESLIRSAENRYRVTVQVAQRAKRRHYDEEHDEDEDGSLKPVVRTIYELSEELMTPEIIAD